MYTKYPSFKCFNNYENFPLYWRGVGFKVLVSPITFKDTTFSLILQDFLSLKSVL